MAETLKETEASTTRWINTGLKLGEIKTKLQELAKIVDAYSDGCLEPVDALKQVIRIVDKEGNDTNQKGNKRFNPKSW